MSYGPYAYVAVVIGAFLRWQDGTGAGGGQVARRTCYPLGEQATGGGAEFFAFVFVSGQFAHPGSLKNQIFPSCVPFFKGT